MWDFSCAVDVSSTAQLSAQGAKEMSDDIIILPDCREENYETLRRQLNDTSNLPRTWEEFRIALELREKEVRAEGGAVERVYIEPEAFAKWCDATSRRSNHAGMYQFARVVWRGGNAQKTN